MKKFSEYLEALAQPAPVAKALTRQQAAAQVQAQNQTKMPTAQPAVQQRAQPSQQDMWRIAQGQFTPEEKVLVNKQKQEMARYGVVFTPFKFYGGQQNMQAQIPRQQNVVNNPLKGPQNPWG